MPPKEQTLQRKKLLDDNKHLFETMTVPEISKKLGIPASTIFYWIEKTKTPYIDSREAKRKEVANETGYFNVNERENWLI